MSDQPSLSRRGFLQGLTAAAASVGAGTLLTREIHAQGPQEATGSGARFDFTQSSAALSPDKTVRSACQFCNSNCAIEVQVRDGRAISLTGVAQDPVQAGELCVKGEMMLQVAYNRHRLTRPLKRVSGAKGDMSARFEPISWDEAFDTIAQKFVALRDQGEARAIANRTSGRMPRGAGSVIGRFFALLGSPNDTDVGPVCNDAGGNALAWTFGLGNFTNGYGVDPATGKEDLGSSDFFFFLGTNQAETHPVTFAHLLRCRQKTKATLVVVDPRKTPTAAYADQWLPIRPHTDMALALGMLSHIVERGLYDKKFVARWVEGFDELAKHLKDHGYTPAWAAQATGLPAEQIEKLAEGFAKAKAASIFCNAGVSHQLGAFDTYRTLAFLSAITGNIGKPGGGCNFMHNTWPGGLNLPPLEGELPARGDALPVGPDAFSDAILDAKPYKLRALVLAGNPLLSSAQTEKVKRAYKALDFLVYTGLFMEESAWYADLILPVCSGLEFEGVYMRRDDRAIRWQDAAIPRVGQSRSDIEIWIGLAHAMARHDKKLGQRWADAFPTAWADYKNLWAEFVRLTPGVGGMTRERMMQRQEPLRWPCPDPKHPGVSTLYMDHPTWTQAAEALGHKGKRFPTPSGKVELWTLAMDKKLAVAGHAALPVFYTHPETTGGLPTLRMTSDYVKNPLNPHALTPRVELDVMVKRPDGFPLVGMIGRPSVVHFAGMTQWTWTGKLLNGVRHIQLHPKVAAQAGLRDGDEMIVESPRGAVRGTARLWSDMREDTLFLGNTFGPAQAAGDEQGLLRYEAANHLLDDHHYDNLSGQQAFKCFACRVKKA